MPLMTNAEAFRYDFGISATELWCMTEEEFLEWLNAWCDMERPADMVVRCKDCKYHEYYEEHHTCEWHGFADVKPDWFCADGEREDDEQD